MIRAYDEIYLDDAMETLGGAVEYAVLFCGIKGEEFLNFFNVSGIADEFGKGNVKYISGMSGIELAQLILDKCGMKFNSISELPNIGYPEEYWVGWILAYYQWYTDKSFLTICSRISYEDMSNLYGVLHEADPSKAVEVFDRIMMSSDTNLARLRKKLGLSQSQLANQTNLSIRSIQLYEQRKADINRAQHNHLKSLSKALNCRIEDLLE